MKRITSRCRYFTIPIALLGILVATMSGASAQMCAPALQREKITPTTGFFDFNGSAPAGFININGITPNSTATNPQQMGWTGGGGGTVYAGSGFTQFDNESPSIALDQAFSRPVTDANLAGTGAVITIVAMGTNGQNNSGNNPNSTQSRSATLNITYGSTTYLSLVTSNDGAVIGTGTPQNGASVTMNGGAAQTTPFFFTMSQFNTYVITLPANIANNNTLWVGYHIGAIGPNNGLNSGDDWGITTTSFKSCPAVVSGSIFNDNNGPTGGVNGTAVGGPGSASGQLYVNLVDASGNVVASVPVAANGSYSLPTYAHGSYTVRVSTTQGTVGQPAPVSGLPTGWFPVSETDGSPNLSQTITVADANTNTALNGNNFGINQPPVAVNDTLANQVQGTAVTVPNILGNDTDPNSGTLSADSITLRPSSINVPGVTYTVDAQGDTVSVTVPGQGTWSLNSTNGGVTFTPQAGFAGDPAPIGYTVTDAAGLNSNTGKIVVTYNHAPAAVNDTASTPMNTPISSSVTANDTCRQGPCSYSPLSSDPPANGTVTVNSDGTYTYTPNTGFTGTDTFSYVVCNSGPPVACDTAQVSITVGNPLPADLLSFTAKAQADCEVLLDWMTGVELSFDRFDIEWGTDGVKFVPVSSVPAKGSGSSYSYLYRHGVKGVNYFRLKETDRDGSYRYSRIATANLGCAPERKIMVYPTVHNGYVTIEGLQTGESVLVYDMKGISVLQAKATGPVVKLNLSHTASGSYTIVILTLTGERMHYKIVKQQ